MLKTVKTRSWRKFILLTPEEGEAIIAASITNPDARPLPQRALALAQTIRKSGQPYVAALKKNVCIRLSSNVAESFRATGKEWRIRMNAAPADWLKTHSPMDAA